MTTKLFAFTGKAGAGKSTAADALEHGLGFERVKFAGPLKAMLRAFYHECGVDDETIERKIEGDLKETPCELLGGKTPRFAMQTLGTEWGRDQISPTLWVDAWRSRVAEELLFGRPVVCDDCRFPNECEAIEVLGGTIIEIVRPGVGDLLDVGGHVSESGVEPHETIINDESTQAMQSAVLRRAFKEPSK
ncbi:MAG: deoxynucleotide monophosphate kinase [Pseudomonadota bacterium]